MQFIRDNAGRSIGLLQTLQNGTRRIFTTGGTNLGWYDPTIDKTISARTGNWIGEGDQTIGLLYQHLGK
jgi:phage/plasmid primase-like uncharacterized protein